MSDETTDPTTGATGDGAGTGGDDDQDDGGPDASVFGEHADYITSLRSESAERRRKLREAEERLTAEQAAHRTTHGRLVSLEIEAAAAGILHDPSDLLVNITAADILDGDGRPDPEKIRTAARGLVERKPHLAPRKTVPAGDVDQGARPPAPEPFDFAAVLRKAAG